MASLAPQWAKFDPSGKLSALALTLSSNPTEQDSVMEFLNTARGPDGKEFVEGTDADRILDWVFFRAGSDPEAAATLLDKAFENKVFTGTIKAMGPSVITKILPSQIEAGRNQGGAQQEKANRLASGDPITDAEYIDFNEKLPIGKQTGAGTMEQFALDTQPYFTAIPGMFTSDEIKLARDSEIEAENSTPITIINPEAIRAGDFANSMFAGPSKGAAIQEKLASGNWMVPLPDSAVDGNPSESGLFGGATPAIKTNLQETLFELRQTSNELIGIEEGFNKDLLTLPNKFRNFRLNKLDSIGIELSAEDEAFRMEFLGNQTRMLTSLTATLNRLSGAAVSPQEFERIKGTRPSPDDTPGEANIKLKTAIALTQFALARLNVFRLIGDDKVGEAFNLRRSDVRGHIRAMLANGEEEEMNTPAGRTREQIQLEVMEEVAAELGVRVVDLDSILNGGPGVTLNGVPR
jgi:hypothetical protein